MLCCQLHFIPPVGGTHCRHICNGRSYPRHNAVVHNVEGEGTIIAMHRGFDDNREIGIRSKQEVGRAGRRIRISGARRCQRTLHKLKLAVKSGRVQFVSRQGYCFKSPLRMIRIFRDDPEFVDANCNILDVQAQNLVQIIIINAHQRVVFCRKNEHRAIGCI